MRRRNRVIWVLTINRWQRLHAHAHNYNNRSGVVASRWMWREADKNWIDEKLMIWQSSGKYHMVFEHYSSIDHCVCHSKWNRHNDNAESTQFTMNKQWRFWMCSSNFRPKCDCHRVVLILLKIQRLLHNTSFKMSVRIGIYDCWISHVSNSKQNISLFCLSVLFHVFLTQPSHLWIIAMCILLL